MLFPLILTCGLTLQPISRQHTGHSPGAPDGRSRSAEPVLTWCSDSLHPSWEGFLIGGYFCSNCQCQSSAPLCSAAPPHFHFCFKQTSQGGATVSFQSNGGQKHQRQYKESTDPFRSVHSAVWNNPCEAVSCCLATMHRGTGDYRPLRYL